MTQPHNSGSRYATSNVVFIELSKLHSSITTMSLSDVQKEKDMAVSMKQKLAKYWDNIDNINLLLYVALILDPRNKMSYLGYSLSLVYGSDAIEKIKAVAALAKGALKELYNAYKSKIDKTQEPHSTSVSTSNGDLEEGYLKYLEKEGELGVDNNEVEIYLRDGKENRADDTFDVLGWWKINSMKFPILSKVARHVLAMPISTVASESAFSTGGRVIDKYRSSLTPKTAEALICGQDWLRSSPSHLQDSDMLGQQLQDIIENLENIEDDMLSGSKTRKDSTVGGDENWE